MDHFNYKNHTLHAEDVPLAEIARAVGTPFYCYSSATLTRHAEVYRSGFGALPVKICFAVKANNTLGVLKTLARAGCGADVVSGGEIYFAQAAGIAPENIVFSGVGKSEEEMVFALQQNIFQFNIESQPELELLAKTAASLKKTAPIAIRVNPNVEPGTHAKISTGQKGSKFGVDMEQAGALYAHAASLSAIRVQGISVHIGSQLTQLAPFEAAYTRVRNFVQDLRRLGLPIRTIDLGGGLGIPYEPQTTPPLPAAYGAMVQRIFSGMDAQLIAEPGRVLVGNAGVLISRVLYAKSGAAREYLILDAGMNDLIRPSMYDAHHDIIPVREPLADAAIKKMDVVGPVCETGDIFARDRDLPLMEAGDLVALRSAGAYGSVMASTYNARPLIAEVLVQGSQFAVLRPRQTYADLLARESLPAWLAGEE